MHLAGKCFSSSCTSYTQLLGQAVPRDSGISLRRIRCSELGQAWRAPLAMGQMALSQRSQS